MDQRALHNCNNSLHCLIPPPHLGTFCHSDKNIVFFDMKQTYHKQMSKLNHLYIE